MGTKSHIAIERENGAVESIRCQYDGYPAYNGALLLVEEVTNELLQKQSVLYICNVTKDYIVAAQGEP